MKILVTGRDGQVARSLAERGSDRDLIFAGRPDLDLSDPVSIERTILAVKPDLIVSAAAYTAVDQAEDEAELAMAVNGVAPGAIGAAAAKVGAGVIHLSTDYVFDGTKQGPYREDDPVAPLGVYGRSKLAGEQALAASGARHVILRTAWVYSPFGKNFLKTMLALAGSRDTLSVVADQHGCPTGALDIADAVLQIAGSWRDYPDSALDQVYHYSGKGVTHWADFARAIFAESAKLGGPTAEVIDITSDAFPSKVTRPKNSALDNSRITERLGVRPRDWREAIRPVVRSVVAG